MAYDFKNTNALITGASSGIGAEFARQLHARGVHVVLVARREDRLRSMADAFNAQRPHSASILVADLLGAEIIQIEKHLAQKAIDLLVCNAGRGSFGNFEKLSLDDEEQMVKLNVLAPLRLMHAAIPQMKKRRAGAIISVASIAAFQPLPYMSTYSATKAFNLSHALALRQELSDFGIRVVALCPGPTATEYHTVAGIPDQWSASYHDSPEDVVAGALAALNRNQGWITPGLRSGALSFFARLLPLELTTKISKRILASALKYLP